MPVIPFVAIEIPAEVAPDLAATTLRTCNMALGSGRCSIAPSGGKTTGSRWLAHVGVDASRPNRFHIDLRDALFQNPATTFSRALDFEPSDVPYHRWSTVGVVVAALVISAESENYSEGESKLPSGSESAGKPPHSGPGKTDVPMDQPGGNQAPKQAKGDPAAPVTATAPTPNESPNDDFNPKRPVDKAAPDGTRDWIRTLRLDVGALLGTGAASNATRYGILLRPAVELSSDYSAWGQIYNSWDSGAVSASGLSAAVGLGVRTVIMPGWLSAEARVGAWTQRLKFEVSDPVQGGDSAARWRYGVGAGLDTWLALSEPLGWFVGIDVVLARPQVVIRVAGSKVGESPTIDAIVATGLRLRIPIF